MSKKDDPRDLNGDGEISKAEKEYWKNTNPDPLSAKELAQKYGFALRVLRGNDELWELFQKAVKGKTAGDQWTPDAFTAALQNSTWWKENSEYARKAWTAQQLGGADWKTSVNTAKQVVQQRAARYGVTLNDNQLRDLAVKYLYEGWEDPRRSGLLDSALSKYLGKEGSVGDVAFQDSLRTLARNYGVNVDDALIDRLQKQIMRGEITEETAQRTIIDRAKSKYAPIADQIESGLTTREVLGQYTSSMAELLEIGDPDQVDLDDPLIKQALGTPGPDGKIMSAWDFEKLVRRDARWAKTKNGQQSYVNVGQEFLKSLGF